MSVIYNVKSKNTAVTTIANYEISSFYDAL